MNDQIPTTTSGPVAQPAPAVEHYETPEQVPELTQTAPASQPTMEERIAKIKNRFWMRARLRLDAETTDDVLRDGVLLGVALAVHKEHEETGVEDWDKWIDSNPTEVNQYLGVDLEDDATKSH